MAGTDIFGYKRNAKPDGVFSSEDSSLTIGDANKAAAGYLVQNWNVEYNQDVQELFEIGSNRLYWAKGRPVGRGVVGRIVGSQNPDMPADKGGLFPENAYDICNGGATMTIKAIGGHCQTGDTAVKLNKGVMLKMSGVVITSVGFAMQVADVRLMENYGWRFAMLEMGAV